MNMNKMAEAVWAKLEPLSKTGKMKLSDVKTAVRLMLLQPGDEWLQLLVEDRNTYREAWKTANDTSQKLWAELLLMQQGAKKAVPFKHEVEQSQVAQLSRELGESRGQVADLQAEVADLKERLHDMAVSQAGKQEALENSEAGWAKAQDAFTDVMRVHTALMNRVGDIYREMYPDHKEQPETVTQDNVRELLDWINRYRVQTQVTIETRDEQIASLKNKVQTLLLWQSTAMNAFGNFHWMLWPQENPGVSPANMGVLEEGITKGINHVKETMAALDAEVKKLRDSAQTDATAKKAHDLETWMFAVVDECDVIARALGMEDWAAKFDRSSSDTLGAGRVRGFLNALANRFLTAQNGWKQKLDVEYRRVWPEGTCPEDGFARLYALSAGAIQFRNDYERVLGQLEVEQKEAEDLHKAIDEVYDALCLGGAAISAVEQMIAIKANAMARTEVSKNVRTQLDNLLNTQKETAEAMQKTIKAKDSTIDELQRQVSVLMGAVNDAVASLQNRSEKKVVVADVGKLVRALTREKGCWEPGDTLHISHVDAPNGLWKFHGFDGWYSHVNFIPA